MNLYKMLNQTTTYWAPGSPDGKGGYTYGSPTSLLGYWDDDSNLVISKSGNEIISKARVLLMQEVEIEGFLFFGTSDSVNPTEEQLAFKIIDVRICDSFHGDNTVYEVIL